ncbi:MAG TPA: UDPGP type 1 family protein [Candidatus Brocadiia bacterium]|nr:UDPGP type 1 family protein [Candidatus Brocadiia bacterium]
MITGIDDKNRLETSLAEFGQSHLTERVLNTPEGSPLRRQILGLDLSDLRIQRDTLARGDEFIPPADDFEPVPAIDPFNSPEYAARLDEARKAGGRLLESGKVAVVTVAGGQGTRLGYPGPKGCYRITPILNKTFFQWHAERILAASRRHGRPLPWFIMTSEHNDAATQAAFEENAWFGLSKDDVFFFKQGSLPILDRSGRLLLDAGGNLLTGPDGHGGLLTALNCSGAMDRIMERGIRYLSYFQIDNVLAKPADPVFLGFHALEGAEVSCKVVQKRDAEEGLGLIARRNGQPCVVEYMEAIRNRMAYLTDREGRLLHRVGSVAIHIFSVSLLDRLFSMNTRLPCHVSWKSMEHINAEGRRVGSSAGDGKVVKFERFIFDTLPFAKAVMVMETPRSEEFAPVKRSEGADSPATARAAMRDLFASWLSALGAEVPEDASIEISPLFAEGPEELAAKLGKKPKLAWPLVLG